MERTKPSLLNERRGTALFAAIGFVAALTILASAFILSLQQTNSSNRRAERRIVALHIAHGGLNKAVAALQRDGAAYTGEAASPLGEGAFTVRVTKGGEPGEYVLESTASLTGYHPGDASVTLQAHAKVIAGQVVEFSWVEGKALPGEPSNEE